MKAAEFPYVGKAEPADSLRFKNFWLFMSSHFQAIKSQKKV